MKKLGMFFATLFLISYQESIGGKINLCERFIVDSDITDESVMKLGAKPVGLVIKEIRGNPEASSATELDISHNSLTNSGAIEVLKYASQLDNLEVLDLSYNRIPDFPQNFGKVGSLEEALFYLINKPKVKCVDLSVNYTATIDWMRSFSGYIAKRLSEQGIRGLECIASIRDKVKWDPLDE